MDNFEFIIKVTTTSNKTDIHHPCDLSTTEKYAIGMMYMDSISTPKQPVEDSDGDDDDSGDDEAGESDESVYDEADDDDSGESNFDDESVYDTDDEDR